MYLFVRKFVQINHVATSFTSCSNSSFTSILFIYCCLVYKCQNKNGMRDIGDCFVQEKPTPTERSIPPTQPVHKKPTGKATGKTPEKAGQDGGKSRNALPGF